MQMFKQFSRLFLLGISVFALNSTKAQVQDKIGKKVELNAMSSVYVLPAATEDDGKNLGDYLLKVNYFDTEKERAVQLIKKGKIFVVKFVVDVPYLKAHQNLRKEFQKKGPELSKNVFNGSPVMIMLVDGDLKPV